MANDETLIRTTLWEEGEIWVVTNSPREFGLDISCMLLPKGNYGKTLIRSSR